MNNLMMLFIMKNVNVVVNTNIGVLVYFISVSYTHLMSYYMNSSTARQNWSNITSFIGVLVGIVAVSYTHLDVYKRQKCCLYLPFASSSA